jgi:bacteriocin leader peptide (microcyclamide/patellamide family)
MTKSDSLHTVFFHTKEAVDPPTEQASTTGQKHKLQKEKTLMDKQNLMPQAAQPVNRTTTGQLPAELAELSEEAFQLYGDSANQAAGVLAQRGRVACSYDDGGDDAE